MKHQASVMQFSFPNELVRNRSAIDQAFAERDMIVADVSYEMFHMLTWVLLTNGQLWILDKSHGGGNRFTLESK